MTNSPEDIAIVDALAAAGVEEPGQLLESIKRMASWHIEAADPDSSEYSEDRASKELEYWSDRTAHLAKPLAERLED